MLFIYCTKLKLMRKLIIYILAFWPLIGAAQLNNTMFEQRNIVNEADSGALFFTMRALGFNKNNEYFGKIADGYTLFGYQFNPSVGFQPTPNTRFDAGIYLQKDFGNDQYTEIAPTFTFTYAFGDAKLIFGTLEGALSHRLIEPLFDFERGLVNRLENGMQLVVENDWIFFDAWADWQNMLYRGENDQEQVTGGLSMNYVLMDKNLKISVPIQMVVTHLGGQIDSSPLPLQTYTNTALGLILDFHRPDISFIDHFQLDAYYTHYNDFSGEQLRPFENGSGVYINAEISTKAHIEFMTSYWRGHEFLTIQGGQIYPSESSSFKNQFTIEEERELLIFRFMHNTKLAKNLTLSSRFEPYLDLKNNRFEFSHAFYVNYNADFTLLKPRKNRTP